MKKRYFSLKHQGKCRVPTSAEKLQARLGPSGGFPYNVVVVVVVLLPLPLLLLLFMDGLELS